MPSPLTKGPDMTNYIQGTNTKWNAGKETEDVTAVRLVSFPMRTGLGVPMIFATISNKRIGGTPLPTTNLGVYLFQIAGTCMVCESCLWGTRLTLDVCILW